MAGEGKKISFGFSKSIKKPLLKNVPLPETKKVDYIECLDEKSIKIVGGEEKKDEPLVIPMLGSATWHDRIVNKVDADIFEPKENEPAVKDELMNNVQDTHIKQEKSDDTPNGNISNDTVQPMEVTEIKKDPDEDQPLTLEEQAAREIIADLKSNEANSKEQKVFAVPVKEDDNLRGKEESTLEDYENIPIDQFGMAMLRGMGWQPGKGIGKNEKVVPAVIPELRPKGMGLGADKLTVQKAKGKSTKEDEQLKLLKGGYAKIVAGSRSGNYGIIEGFDEEAARIILKLSLGGDLITVNELWVQPVSSTEYSESSKVLNSKKYQEYKNNEVIKSDGSKRVSSDTESSDEDRNKSNGKSKKKLKKRKHQSDDDSSPEKKSRKKKDSSNSSDEQKSRRSKKSKKHKNRDSSSERSIRKDRKKDRERERTKHKRPDHSEFSERSKHKTRRRSRSRSRSSRDRKKSRSRSRSPRNRRRSRSHSSRDRRRA